MAVDKNQAIIDYLITCPQILNSPLYFNFINAKDNNNQIITTNEFATNTRYIDGSIAKRYTFNLITFKSITNSAVVKISEYTNENVADLSDVQALIDWIDEQNEAYNFPNFGEDCIVDSISTTTDTPTLQGINDEVTPPLAMYSISIQVDYLDISRKLWK